MDQARRLRELERKNAGLRKAVAAPTLDKLFLKEAASGNV
jgi:putative transposase